MNKILVIAAIFLCTGCATIGARDNTNAFTSTPGMYPGTQMDTFYIKTLSPNPALIFFVADLPISLVFDTLLLPVDYYRSK